MKKVFFIIIVFASILKAQVDLGNTKISELLSLQKISVTIGGDFFVNGTFPASATERVDEFLTRIYSEVKETALRGVVSDYTLLKIKDEISEYAQREIKLKRFDGTELTLDLMKFRITADFAENPYLKNGDVIIIPALDMKNNFIAIDGAVNKSIKFQYVEGDKLSDAIQFAMGINPAYNNVEKADISRLSYDGSKEEQIIVDISDDFVLQRADRIKIVADKVHKLSYKALVIGEVNRPGYIYITKNNTTLAEVIEKAGGITKNAWLKKANVIRGKGADFFNDKEVFLDNNIKELEYFLKWDNMLMTRMSNLAVEDTFYFKLENELKFYNELGLMDLSELTDSESDVHNMIIKDEDVILIPEFDNTVNVFGQVPHTGKYEVVKEKDYKYYINKAGGLGEEANEEIMLIKANSRNWISVEDNNNVAIEPGDILWVPKEPVRNFGYYLSRVGSIASILGAVATIILIFK